MVKLPVNVAADGNTDWQHTLDDAHKKLEELAGEAVSLQHDGRYIRPIAVVRVERTGTDQRGGVHLHASGTTCTAWASPKTPSLSNPLPKRN